MAKIVHQISYKQKPRDMELYLYVEGKGDKSNWIKDAIEEKKERELKGNLITTTNNNFPIMQDIPMFNGNF